MAAAAQRTDTGHTNGSGCLCEWTLYTGNFGMLLSLVLHTCPSTSMPARIGAFIARASCAFNCLHKRPAYVSEACMSVVASPKPVRHCRYSNSSTPSNNATRCTRHKRRQRNGLLCGAPWPLQVPQCVKKPRIGRSAYRRQNQCNMRHWVHGHDTNRTACCLHCLRIGAA